MVWSDIGVRGFLFGPIATAGKQVISKCCDFIVSEKITVEEGMKHPLYLVVKERTDTFHALHALRKAMKCREISYCGLKDKYSLSIQHVVPIDCKQSPGLLYLDNIVAKKIGYVDRPLMLGENTHNDFFVRISMENIHELGRFMEKASKKLVFPNFVGYQRFGLRRPYTHELGLAYLKYLLGERDELTGLLSKKDGWWEMQLLRKGYIDESIKLLLIHSVQSYYFNECLSELLLEERLHTGEIQSGILIGYDFRNRKHPGWVNKKHVDCIEDRLSKDDWLLQALEKLGIRTRYRVLLGVAEILSYKRLEETMVIGFRLNPGFYGTVFLRELVGDKGSVFQDCEPCLKTMANLLPAGEGKGSF